MFAVEKLHDVIEQSLIIPNEADVSLKLYCTYFERYIDGCVYNVEIANGKEINVKIKAKKVPHIILIFMLFMIIN